ncbi:OmpH family outer membrane protein [bacterium]|nr:OmpH family outer membrane protein [bacterium]
MRFYIALSMALILLFSSAIQAQSKIGYVDSKKIRDSYEAVRDAEKLLNEENRKWEQELSEKNRNLDKMEKELETYSLLLSNARKKERTDEISALHQEIQQFQKQVWGDAGQYFKKQEELLRPIYENIKVAVDEIADDRGLDIVFDSIEGNILFAKENMDITEDVIELLRRQSPKKKNTNRGR